MSSILTGNGWLQLAVSMAVMLACVIPLGGYMAKVFQGQKNLMSPVFGWLEKLLYKACGIDPDADMDWKAYAMAVLLFSAVSFVLLYVMLLCQKLLPLNPQGMPGTTPDLAFNTSASFLTNTNWQSYAGEAAMSYFTQMVGLTVQNFVTPAVGLAVMVALIRGLTRRQSGGIGNFWTDMIRANLYILLPLSLILAVILGSQGVVQTFAPSIAAHGLQGADQLISVGPVASQEAIKMLGTNGGGFFNANSAHPFENPTPLTNFLEVIGLLLIPAACCHTFGVMVGDRRQGFAILAAMTIIFVPLMVFGTVVEQGGNPHFAALHIDQTASALQAGGNMEGKETRFGIVSSTFFAAATTAVSCGAVNAMHDSFTPMGGFVPLLLMKFGEVIYGGAGAGLYGMLIFVILTVFIAGLMVGRTPEYLGKKIQAFEIKMASVAMLAPCLFILIGTAVAVMTKAGQAGIFNPGAQGFSEILYAFTSATNNNGSAFAGLSANTPFYNTALGICMLAGRFFIIIPVLAIAGSLAAKKTVPVSAGTLPTHNGLFVATLIGIVVIVGVLTYAPTLALGPVVEHFNMRP
ncbi:potassium-transporting ATPase subunit KdpA [Asticcacaulis sp. 201]|uniref:potassium-transporting ATPase subunit KdpA n=1 Tax=Asticcacaulis sp. 201 TaxID=3028787 RepID=UPI002916E37F|nr:potassium-transporting ATPase subunit KdpA [Asticcacaulis sp. 201]MDV6333047.1 potassium-transporting ATPase subunit KdpA [Asticcacaulis sp. 201]